jgi:uncharacterized membrane protein
MKSIFISCCLLLTIFFSSDVAIAQEVGAMEILEGQVTEIVESSEKNDRAAQVIKIVVTGGSLKGETITVDTGRYPTPHEEAYKKGDQLVINYMLSPEGEAVFQITDYSRRLPLYVLAGIFLLLAVLVGGWKGLGSFFGLVVSFLAIFKIILPLILAGHDPVLTAVLGGGIVAFITFYLSHGFNKNTSIALLGTFLSLVVTALLAKFFLDWSNITGFASEEASFLITSGLDNLNFRGLVLAGVIIGALGVLDDITISQVAIVQELKNMARELSPQELFVRSMRVGREHIASLINTLVLVYTGASLPLLLLFHDSSIPIEAALNFEIVAEEVIRTLVGSIGLITAVPLTSLIASRMVKENNEFISHSH